MSFEKPVITYLIFNTKNNGGNRIIFEQANRLSQKGYRVIIFSLFSKNPDWFPLKINIKNMFAWLFTKSDILIATFWPTAYLAFFFRANRKFYLIQGIEADFYKNLLLKKLALLTYRFPFQKIAVSSFVIRQIKKNTSAKSTIIQINGSGIDHSLFKPRANLPGKKELKILSVVSSYSFTKGIDLLIKAVAKIKSLHPDYSFTLVSPESKSADHIFDRFISNPKRIKLAKLYQESDILLSTGRSEGFFLPGLEAMACGCIFISTDSGGVLDYAENKKNCLILNSLADLWKKDIIEKLMSDIKLKKTLIQNGYETVKQYKWERIIKRLENILLS